MSRRKFFITARSFAAPFFSDTSEEYVSAATPEQALEKFAARYDHPCGLFAAEAWRSADDYHQGKKFLAQWLSNRAAWDRKHIKAPCTVLGKGPGIVEVDGVTHTIDNPKAGAVVAANGAKS